MHVKYSFREGTSLGSACLQLLIFYVYFSIVSVSCVACNVSSDLQAVASGSRKSCLFVCLLYLESRVRFMPRSLVC